MSIYMINKGWAASDGTINTQIDYEIYNERVSHVEVTKLVGELTLGAITLPDYYWLCLCVDSDGSNAWGLVARIQARQQSATTQLAAIVKRRKV